MSAEQIINAVSCRMSIVQRPAKILTTWYYCKPQLLGLGLVLAGISINPAWSARPVVAADFPPSVQVTTREDSVLKVEEYRVNGQLRHIKVNPRGQLSYVLPDYNSDGSLDRLSEDFSRVLSIPHWTLSSW